MTYKYRNNRPARSLRTWLLILIPLLALAGATVWFINQDDSPNPPANQSVANDETQDEPEEDPYQPVDLQPVIDSWAASQAADYSILVWDAQSKTVIGQNEPEQVIFAASLYKIFVAYLALVDFQEGRQDPNEILVAGQTKKECVDKMIRSSDSPCGEAMMAEMGQLNLNQRVAEIGMTGTFFNGIRTSAKDSALILQYIVEKRDLNDENTEFILDSMRVQDAKWRRGLATGAPEATWETKVGWNEDINYHDIGIMTLPDGRKFVVTILGQGSGRSAPVADFARTIYAALTQ